MFTVHGAAAFLISAFILANPGGGCNGSLTFSADFAMVKS
jgi:hypothetical protein